MVIWESAKANSLHKKKKKVKILIPLMEELAVVDLNFFSLPKNLASGTS